MEADMEANMVNRVNMGFGHVRLNERQPIT
jgi:hypothetical protein